MVRIVAEWRKDGRRESNYKFFLLCGLDNDARLADGEWMGYIKDDEKYWPFILRGGSACFYGGNEPWSEFTNIGQKTLREGEMFSVDAPIPSEGEYTYEITHCHCYARGS